MTLSVEAPVARIGVAAHDHPVDRGANDRLFEAIAGLTQPRSLHRDRRLFGGQRGLGALDGVARLIDLLAGDDVAQGLEPRQLPLRRGDLHLCRPELSVCLGQTGLGGRDRQARRVVLLAREDLALGHAIPLDHPDFPDDTGRAGRDLDDAALHVGLPRRDGGVR